MSSQLNRIEEKIDRLDLRLDQMDVQLAVYNGELKIHIAGVQDAREESKRIRADLKPVKDAWNRAKAIFWFVGWLLASFTAVGGAILLGKSLGLF